MIVGNDEKPGTDAQGKPVVNPTGNDTVVIFDLARPEDPKVVASLKLENSDRRPADQSGDLAQRQHRAGRRCDDRRPRTTAHAS